jgi:predicted NodU family carbamoyl transferase
MSFGSLRRRVELLTGVPILINTSANLAGEPIINSVDGVIEMMRSKPIDAIVLVDEQMIIQSTKHYVGEFHGDCDD